MLDSIKSFKRFKTLFIALGKERQRARGRM